MFLESHNITKSFGNFTALEDVSFAVQEGSVFGLLGPNGAGKTTMIRIINRIIRADRGELLLKGNPLTDEMVRSIGYLPEERGLYKKMRVGEQATYLAQLKGLSRGDATAKLRHWFEKFDIGSWWDRPVEQLSKGMQQKVQFVVTVLHEPSLLIFDEPFSGFDPVNATLLKNEIMELRRKGATVILSTHNMASVEELCDDIALIDCSHVVLSGAVSQIRKSFSKNIFEVVVVREGCRFSAYGLPEWCRHISDSCSSENELTLRFRLSDGKHSNDLLALLMQSCSIVSFREILPTMNDIFVETITVTRACGSRGGND